MGFMIQLLFEPSILGAEYLWCTSCGRVLEMDSVIWRTDSNPSVGRNADGSDAEESPHHPTCPCGENEVIGEAVHDGFVLRMKGERVWYPRRVQDDGITRKPIMVWNKVKPYRTKKGKMSEWKPDKVEGDRQESIYDNLQGRLAITWDGDDMDGNLAELRDVLGVPVSWSIYSIANRNGLVVIRNRRAWHGKRKMGMRPDFTWKPTWDLDVGDKIRCLRNIGTTTDPKMVKVWDTLLDGAKGLWFKTDPYGRGTAGDEAITRDGMVRTMRFVDLAEYDRWLNEHGYSMNRGAFQTVYDADDPDYGCSFWYDPHEGRYVMVADSIDGWAYCGYDEAQGEDEEVLYDEDNWVVSACEAAVDPATEEPEEETLEDSEDSEEPEAEVA